MTALHFVGGVVGGLLIGFLATPTAPSGATGLLYGGSIELLGRQVLAIAAVFAYTFTVTWILAKVLDRTVGSASTTRPSDVASTSSCTPRTRTRTLPSRRSRRAVMPNPRTPCRPTRARR